MPGTPSISMVEWMYTQIDPWRRNVQMKKIVISHPFGATDESLPVGNFVLMLTQRSLDFLKIFCA